MDETTHTRCTHKTAIRTFEMVSVAKSSIPVENVPYMGPTFTHRGRKTTISTLVTDNTVEVPTYFIETVLTMERTYTRCTHKTTARTFTMTDQEPTIFTGFAMTIEKTYERCSCKSKVRTERDDYRRRGLDHHYQPY